MNSRIDQRIQTLKRSFAETGAPEIEEELIGLRISTGDLSLPHAKILAIFGLLAARSALPPLIYPTARVWLVKLGKGKKTHGASPLGGTFCGRRNAPLPDTDIDDLGFPTCVSCLRSDEMRQAFVGELANVVLFVAREDTAIGYRLVIYMIHEVFAREWGGGANGQGPALLRYASWCRAGMSDRPPAPTDPPNPWDPAAVFARGPRTWMYTLGAVALDANKDTTRPAMRQGLARIARQVGSFVLGRVGAISLATLLSEMRLAFIPYLLGEAGDPLEEVERYWREAASLG